MHKIRLTHAKTFKKLRTLFDECVGGLYTKNGGRAIGIVMSGLLIGVLGSRIVRGLVGERFGWQMMQYTARF